MNKFKVMAKARINSKEQLERIQIMRAKSDFLKKQSFADLTKTPNPKSWSAIEAIEHMVIAHKAYEDKIDNCLKELGASNQDINEVTARSIPSYLIKRFPPKEGKIKFKMKTFKRFYPIFNIKNIGQDQIDLTLSNFEKSLDHLESAVKLYPSKNVESIKFNSAIGATVKFNVAEACEFVICHNERHLLQAENVLGKSLS